MTTHKRYVQTPPPLTVGVIPDTGEEVVYPTLQPEPRGSGNQGGGTSRATVKQLIKQNRCCPPIVGGWAQQVAPPATIPALDSGLRLVLQPVVGLPEPAIQSFILSVGKMQDPNSSSAKVELIPSPFNTGTAPTLDSVVYIPDANPVFDLLQVNLDTFGAEISILDLVLTNSCGCCTVVPVEMVMAVVP